VTHAQRAKLAAALLTICSGCGDADSEAGAWEFKVDTVSSAGGSGHPTSWLRVVGQEGAEGEPRTRPVILSFDCLPDDASSRIMTDQSLRQGSVESRLTLDADPPLGAPGFAGTTPSGGQVVLTIPQDSLLAMFGGHQRAIIEYADGAGSSKTTAEFPLAGLETYRDSFLTSCAERRR
jgi:hypothetical protein